MTAEDIKDGDIRWLDVSDLILINAEAIERYSPRSEHHVRDQGALESAQQRPAVHRYYAQTNDLMVLAAVLYTALIWNHPFHDGNKRTAHMACRMFLLLNGAEFLPPLQEALDMATAVATHECDEYIVAEWISRHTRPIDCQRHLGGEDDAPAA